MKAKKVIDAQCWSWSLQETDGTLERVMGESLMSGLFAEVPVAAEIPEGVVKHPRISKRMEGWGGGGPWNPGRMWQLERGLLIRSHDLWQKVTASAEKVGGREREGRI